MADCHPRPDGVERPILFVFDDAVETRTNVRRIFHTPRKHAGNPVRRPELGLHPHDGNAGTNTLLPGVAGKQSWFLPSLIRHPAPPDPSWSYVLYAWGWGERQGLFGHKSRDGLRFERFSEQPLLSWGYFGPGRINDVAMACWDRGQARFVMYATVLLPQALEERTP